MRHFMIGIVGLALAFCIVHFLVGAVAGLSLQYPETAWQVTRVTMVLLGVAGIGLALSYAGEVGEAVEGIVKRIKG